MASRSSHTPRRRRQADQPSSAPIRTPSTPIAGDCLHYLGDRPCKQNRLCTGCTEYQPVGKRICIIKLGALGDVVRTLCILPELRRRYPSAHITWVSLPNGCRMIGEHPDIDRIMPFDVTTAMVLQQERFDTLISLDKEPAPCALAMSLRAGRKLGIGLNRHGKPVPLNRECEPYFHLGLSDELKFQVNRHSYPRLIHEALGWRYSGQRYTLPLNELAADHMRLRLASAGWQPDRGTVGIFVGAGRAFANKMWPAGRTVQLISAIRSQSPDAHVLLLGGPDERSTMDVILAELRQANADSGVLDAGTDHNEREFVALVDACDVLFAGDTMAMHVAIARNRRVVAFFGPTCEQEIDLFGLGEKLVAQVNCRPCYKRVCDQNDVCLHDVSVQSAADAVVRQLHASLANERPASRNIALPVMPTRRAG